MTYISSRTYPETIAGQRQRVQDALHILEQRAYIEGQCLQEVRRLIKSDQMERAEDELRGMLRRCQALQDHVQAEKDLSDALTFLALHEIEGPPL